ncbi:MAG: hypothetical protein PSX37_13725, partial [bacterium]|nr:hypothetical protein [bacterium]
MISPVEWVYPVTASGLSVITGRESLSRSVFVIHHFVAEDGSPAVTTSPSTCPYSSKYTVRRDESGSVTTVRRSHDVVPHAPELSYK